jgi:hypothetical protein
MLRAVMLYAVSLLLLSACAGVPESQTGTYDADGTAIGPNTWGYAQGMAAAGAANCFYPGYPSYTNAYGMSYNCATPLLFYSRVPYYPYYASSTAQRWRPYTPGTGHGTHKSSGSGFRGGKRK